MKPLIGLLDKIRSLPEEARRLLAGVFLIVAVLAGFNLWTQFLTSRLTNLSYETRFLTPEEQYVQVSPSDSDLPEQKIFSPAESITESAKNAWATSVKGFIEIWRYVYEPLR